MEWKTLEPLLVTSIVALIGWALLEITTMKVNVAKIQTEVTYIRDDIKALKNQFVAQSPNKNLEWRTYYP